MLVKVKIKWTNIKQKAFDEIEWIVACNILLTYTKFNTQFDIHIYYSDFQLGAVIIQEGKPIGFYSRKHTGTPKRYMVIEKELLRIVKTLGVF